MKKSNLVTNKYILLITIMTCIFQFSTAQYVVNNDTYININSGGNLNIEGSFTNNGTGTITNEGAISVSGDITNNASTTMCTGSGSLELNGTAAQSIDGTNSIDFYNLIINNTSTGITLSTDVAVSNTLSMADGDVDMNGQNISLGTTGTLTGETNDNRIYGTSGNIETTRSLNAPNADDVAGLGLEITSASDLGVTLISRGHGVQTSSDGNTSIERYYDITTSNNSGLDATIIINYFDNELGSHTEANLVTWNSAEGSSVWTNEGGTINTTDNKLSLSGIDGFEVGAFSRWTLSDEINHPLPVELLSFEAVVMPRLEVQLEWITTSEVNSSHFEVERSQNGEDFEWIGTVEAMGFSEDEIIYDLLDEKPYQGISYYRLRQLDLDGSFEYSKTRAVHISDEEKNITVFPNPIRQEAILYLQGLPDNENTQFELYNVKGQLLMNRILGKMESYEMKLQNFPSGSYFYVIRNTRGILKTDKLIIQE